MPHLTKLWYALGACLGVVVAPVVVSAGFLLASLLCLLLLAVLLLLPLARAILPEPASEQLAQLGPRACEVAMNWIMQKDLFDQATSEVKTVMSRPPMRRRRRQNPARGAFGLLHERELGLTRPAAEDAREEAPASVLAAANKHEQQVPSLVTRVRTSLQPVQGWFCLHGRRCRGMHGERPREHAPPGEPSNFMDANKREAWTQECLTLLGEVTRLVCDLPMDAGLREMLPGRPLAFVVCGGADALVEFILCTVPEALGGRGRDVPFLRDNRPVQPGCDEYMLGLWATSLEILREVCLCIPSFCERLGRRRDLLRCVFELMRVRLLFDSALHLAEELLCGSADTVDIAVVPDLDGLVRGLDAVELTKFCHVLGTLVQDREELLGGEQALCLELMRSRARSSREDVVMYTNQERLVASPFILQRIVHVLRREASRSLGRLGRHRSRAQRLGGAGPGLAGGPVDDEAPLELPPDAYRNANLTPLELWQMVQENLSGAEPARQRQLAQLLFMALNNSHGLLGGSGARRRDDWAAMPEPLSPEALALRAALFASGEESASAAAPAAAPAAAGAAGPRRGPGAAALAGPAHAAREGAAAASTSLATAIAAAAPAGGGPAGRFLTATLHEALNTVLRFANIDSARIRLGEEDQSGGGETGQQQQEDDMRDPHPQSDAGDDEVQHLHDEEMHRMVLQEASMLVEVFFVLAVLAGGKARARANELLASFGIIDVLADLFPLMGWERDDHEDAHEGGGIHGANCECNPGSALKIQFLRLVHNFCDRDHACRDNKRLLLSPLDLRAVELLRGDAPLADRMAAAAALYQEPQQDQAGLLVNLVRLLLTNSHSQYRFWLAMAIESFLRGASPEEQLLLSSLGLMDHLLTQFLDNTAQAQDMVQMDFDLFGVLVCFNRDQFELLDSKLDADRFQRLARLATTHLVDSNVFIRTVIMSLAAFRSEGRPLPPDHFLERFLREHSAEILQSLMTSVQLEAVSQENICCINTALLMLVQARRDGDLAETLRAVEDFAPRRVTTAADDANVAPAATQDAADDESGTAVAEEPEELQPSEEAAAFPGQGGPALANFRRLLWFWRQHYQQRASSDRQSLTASSRIPFEEWRELVDVLCADDGGPCSLLRRGQRLRFPDLMDLLLA